METGTDSKFLRFLGSYPILWISAAILLETAIAGLAGQWMATNRRAGECDPPRLVLGAVEYTIKTIQPEADGSFEIPAGQANTAFWVEGTSTNQIFGLSQAGNDQGMRDALKSGSTVTVTWANCNSTSYILGDPLPEGQDLASLMDQAIFGITLIIQPGPSAPGFAVRGELQEAVIKTFDTAEPSGIQAEISLLGVTPSEDGRTIVVTISVLNTGQSAARFSAADISLTAEDGGLLNLEKSEPGLPIKIQPGSTDTFSLTFIRPSTPTATMNVLGVEYDIEGY